MAIRTIANDLFDAIATQIGFKICLGNNNLCNVKPKSTDEEFIVELPHNGEILYIYSVIGNVPFDNREPFLECLLKHNLHGVEINQCNIGIDVQTNKFILSPPLLIPDLDEIVLISLLNGFFTSVPKLTEHLVHLL
jgi:hypothetical protein